MESTLGLEIIEVVELAAIASSKWMGKGEKDTADKVAVDAMRERMNKIHMRLPEYKYQLLHRCRAWELHPVRLHR